MEQTVRGFPTIKPFGYPNATYPRVVVQQDVRHVDGRVVVEKGATGIRVAVDRGFVQVLFDEGQSCIIEPDGANALIRMVPVTAVKTEFPVGSGKFC